MGPVNPGGAIYIKTEQFFSTQLTYIDWLSSEAYVCFREIFLLANEEGEAEERVSGHPTPAYLAYFELMRG